MALTGLKGSEGASNGNGRIGGVIAALILAVGGVRLVRRERQRGLLMIAVAVVIFGNVLIWTV